MDPFPYFYGSRESIMAVWAVATTAPCTLQAPNVEWPPLTAKYGTRHGHCLEVRGLRPRRREILPILFRGNHLAEEIPSILLRVCRRAFSAIRSKVVRHRSCHPNHLLSDSRFHQKHP